MVVEVVAEMRMVAFVEPELPPMVEVLAKDAKVVQVKGV
jgi:hypothetical protein